MFLLKKATVFLLIAVMSCFFVAPRLTVFAQTADQVAAREAELRAELDQVLKDITAQQQILASEQQKGQTLERDIAILNAKIQEAKLKIKARQIAIEALGKDINKKTDTINQLTGKIEDTRDSLAQLIRKTNEMDEFTLPEVVLSDKDLSEFFTDVDDYDSIKESIQVALGYIKKTKVDTEVAKQTLDRKRLQEIDARISIETEKANIEKSEKEKARLLSLSKEQQKNYQSEIKKKEARAAQIRSALFALRDAGAIPFGQALEYANAASRVTGVRPAFLLAILTQESNLGKNVGSCYVTDLSTGAGVKVSTGELMYKVMNASRDIPPFLTITSAVGRDPKSTRVSCPLSSGGYGGAMGPAQFIPSTWALFQNRIAQAIGHAPDPWIPQDAFMASALYLSDLGAGSQSYSGERNAACRYYSGRSCDSRKPANSFYGDSVMQKAADIQKNMIDPLSGV